MQHLISKTHHGEISDFLINRLGKIYGYRIQENGTEYIAHLGDIKKTEELLYKIRDHESNVSLELENFKKGDKVDFEVFGEKRGYNPKKHAIHVSHSKI